MVWTSIMYKERNGKKTHKIGKENEKGILKGLNPRDKKGGDGINDTEGIIFLTRNEHVNLKKGGDSSFYSSFNLNQLHLE